MPRRGRRGFRDPEPRLPPGVTSSTPGAPWNQPDPEDMLPMECGECGFVADSMDELDDHEHGVDEFDPLPPEPSKDYDALKDEQGPPPEAVEDEPGPPMVPKDALDDEGEEE